MEKKNVLVDTRGLATQLGITVGQLAQMRYRGTGPKFVRIGPKTVRYRQEDIDQWIESRVISRTDEPVESFGGGQDVA